MLLLSGVVAVTVEFRLLGSRCWFLVTIDMFVGIVVFVVHIVVKTDWSWLTATGADGMAISTGIR